MSIPERQSYDEPRRVAPIFGETEQPGFVKTGDDTLHTITHVGQFPLNHVELKGKLMNVLHVLTIMKNLVSVG